MKAKGEVDEAAETELHNKIKDRYEEQTSPYYAASRIWLDAIIDPRETRDWLSMGLSVADSAQIEKFNVGVIQT